MKKVLGYGLLAGLLIVVFNIILNFLFALIFPSFNAIYQNTAIFRPMTDPASLLFWLYPFVLGIAFAWAWNKSKNLFKAKNICRKGFNFALAYLFIAVIPAFFINVGSFNLPVLMILSWSIMNFINAWVAGALLAKLNK